MHAFDNAIGLEHEKLAAIMRFHYSAVIAGPATTAFPSERRGKSSSSNRSSPRSRKFHGEKISGNARAVSVSELKSECIVIATRMEPLHS